MRSGTLKNAQQIVDYLNLASNGKEANQKEIQ